jgi:cytoplasmic iron level regulating protein YaaA (DUF328/UPF0246 family)
VTVSPTPTLARVLILLPPSEGKAAPRRGRALDPGTLSAAMLTDTRERILDALIDLAERPEAASVLGLGGTQTELVALNARLRTAPTARADAVYTGVLYDALGFDTLSSGARRRATSRVAITSSVFGLVRPGDRIPAYRLSGDVSLPGLGPVAALWRESLGEAVEDAVGSGLLMDLRSTMYAAFWRPPTTSPGRPNRTATVRVLHEVAGARKVVSHFNKATKGRIVRDLLEAGANPRTPQALADALGDLGWHVELGEPTPRGTQLDVVVREI